MSNPNLPIAGNYNTYVGARYVPKFGNKDLDYQWTNTRKYEPLTIVLYQGNSYTSTTFVPMGVDINNKTYWAQTGNYNAQMEQILSQITNLESLYNSKLESMDNLLVFPKVIQSTQPEGFTGCLLYNSGHGIIFDTGLESNKNEIISSYQKHGLKVIDAIIISHWHDDHAGIVDWSSFDTSQTVCYIPYTTSKYEPSTYWHDRFVNAFSDNQLIYPISGQTFTVDKYTLAFFNCGQNDIAYWDSQNANYNNYSMTVNVMWGNNNLYFPGDIQAEAQSRLYDNNNYYQSNFAAAPHHGVDSGGTIELGRSVNPAVIYFADQIGGAKHNSSHAFTTGAVQAGGKVYSNAESNNDLLFQFFEDGFISTTAPEIPFLAGYADINMYVSYSSTSPHANGTSLFPFRYLSQAISQCVENRHYIITVLSSDNDNIVFKGISNVTIILNETYSCPTVVLEDCHNIRIKNGTFSGYVRFTRSSVTLENVITNKMEVSESKLTFLNCTFNPDTSNYMIASYSDLTFKTSTFNGNAPIGFRLIECSCKFWETLPALSSHCTNLLQQNNSIINIPNLATEIVNKLNNNTSGAMLVYDNVLNKPYILYSGNKFEIVTA